MDDMFAKTSNENISEDHNSNPGIVIQDDTSIVVGLRRHQRDHFSQVMYTPQLIPKLTTMMATVKG